MDALIAQLQKQYRDHTIPLYQQGFLDDQFTELKEVQDDDSPDFVAEVLTSFFEDCAKHISTISTALDQTPGTVDFRQVDAIVHQLKGSSSSVGAKKIKTLCVNFREYCESQNLEECKKCLEQVDTEYKTLQTKLQEMFNLEKQIIEAGGKVPQVP